MLVKEVMPKNPNALSEEMTLKQAICAMPKHNFGFLPVKHDGQMIEVFTDRNLVIRALANGLDPNKAKLKEVITKELYYCHEDDDIKKVADMLCQKQVHRLFKNLSRRRDHESNY